MERRIDAKKGFGSAAIEFCFRWYTLLLQSISYSILLI
nr:MAG TPA: hypothetical protein [Caudoviricetes sp.]